MIWNDHSKYEGQHAFLSASKYHWINYDDDKLIFMYKRTVLAAQEGTETHDFASRCIKRRQKLPKTNQTLNLFVNDAIGYRMNSEQVLYFSDNCFGTADAICFNGKLLRIHDLKTGVTTTHMEQLMVYAALFCLEYGVNPKDIDIELRIYQCNDIEICKPPAEAIIQIMATIQRFDKLINKVKEEGS